MQRTSYTPQIILSVIGGIIVIGGLMFGLPAYGRYQKVQEAHNEIQVNDMKIGQTRQLVEVEKQKAQIKVAEANGLAESQRIINATLTPAYLQHEAIQAQEHMADSPNHTTIYIPTGQNGIPLVGTLDK
jgi:hypothetical protein